jgi:hypothetical protein
MRPIKKQRVDMMAILKNYELRIMVVERSIMHLVQAISTSTQAQKEIEPSCALVDCTGEPGHQHESGSAANTESGPLQLEEEHR